MKRRKKSWRTFKTRDSRLRKEASCQIRRMCGMILVIEAIVLWKQGQFPVITVDRQSDVQIAQSDSVNKSVTIQTDGLAAEESETEWEEAGQQTVLEQVFGVRLRVEEGVIEFYRKEEKIDVIPGEK